MTDISTSEHSLAKQFNQSAQAENRRREQLLQETRRLIKEAEERAKKELILQKTPEEAALLKAHQVKRIVEYLFQEIIEEVEEKSAGGEFLLDTEIYFGISIRESGCSHEIIQQLQERLTAEKFKVNIERKTCSSYFAPGRKLVILKLHMSW